MIEDGLGFSLVPWKPALDRHLAKQISGLVLAKTVDWNFGRKRTLEYLHLKICSKRVKFCLKV
jgi:Protein of unknown function (DUF3363)